MLFLSTAAYIKVHSPSPAMLEYWEMDLVYKYKIHYWTASQTSSIFFENDFKIQDTQPRKKPIYMFGSEWRKMAAK